jgi:hypothetical protein
MRRPPDWGAAVAIEAMQTKMRITKSLLAEVYPDFMAGMLRLARQVLSRTILGALPAGTRRKGSDENQTAVVKV